MTAPDAALQEVLLETKGFVQDMNHKQTLEAVQLGRRQFSGVPDAQHWIAGLGFVPIISSSPLDALSGAYQYAGVIWGQDGGEPVSAAVFPVKSLPLDDIKSKRATIYLGQSILNKAGTSEGAKKGWEHRAKAGDRVSHTAYGSGAIKNIDMSGDVGFASVNWDVPHQQRGQGKAPPPFVRTSDMLPESPAPKSPAIVSSADEKAQRIKREIDRGLWTQAESDLAYDEKAPREERAKAFRAKEITDDAMRSTYKGGKNVKETIDGYLKDGADSIEAGPGSKTYLVGGGMRYRLNSPVDRDYARVALHRTKVKKSFASEWALRDMVDELMGKSKAGEKEGHEFRGNQYKKKPVAPKADIKKPGKASALKPGAGKKIAKKVEPPPKKTAPAKKTTPAPVAKKPTPKPAPKPSPAKPKTLADMPKAKLPEPTPTPTPPAVSKPAVIGSDGDFKPVTEIGANDLVLPKAKVSYDGNTYTMVGNTSNEHAKYFHLQSSAQNHAAGMNAKFPGHTHEVIPFESMKLYSVGRLVSGTPHAVPQSEPAPPKPKQMSGGGLEVPGGLGVPSQGKKVVYTWTNTPINDIESASAIPPKGEVTFKGKIFTAVPDGKGGVKVHESIKLAASEANMLNAMAVTHKKFMPLYLKQSKQYIVGLEKDPNEKLPEKTESMLIPGTPFLAADEEGGEVPTMGGKVPVQEAFEKPPAATTNVDIGGLSGKGTPKNPYAFSEYLSDVELKPGMAFADEEGNVLQIVSKPGDKGAPYAFPMTESGAGQALSAATHMSEKYGPYFGAAPVGGDKAWAVMVMADKFNPSAKPKGAPESSGLPGYGNTSAVPDTALESQSSGTNEAEHDFSDLPFNPESVGQLADTVSAKIGVPKAEIYKALSSHADPSNAKQAKIRVQVESAILKSHTAIKDAVQHVKALDDAKEKSELLEVLTTGDVKRAQLEYAQTPLYDLQCLSKITVYDHPVQGQANCNLESRSMNMGTTSVTGDFRHELGHAIHGALGVTQDKEQTNPMLVALSKHFDTVKAAMKAHPEGMGTGKGEPGTPGAKMSHQWYMENYHIIGRRGADNWLEDFAELYRGYHKAAYMDSAQKVSGLKGGNLDEFRKYFPTIARLLDARYTAAIMGSMAKKGSLK